MGSPATSDARGATDKEAASVADLRRPRRPGTAAPALSSSSLAGTVSAELCDATDAPSAGWVGSSSCPSPNATGCVGAAALGCGAPPGKPTTCVASSWAVSCVGASYMDTLGRSTLGAPTRAAAPAPPAAAAPLTAALSTDNASSDTSDACDAPSGAHNCVGAPGCDTRSVGSQGCATRCVGVHLYACVGTLGFGVRWGRLAPRADNGESPSSII